MNNPIRPSATLYGFAMTEAIVSGDLSKMKDVAAAAEKHLADHGDVAQLLQVLKVEIAKAQAGA